MLTNLQQVTRATYFMKEVRDEEISQVKQNLKSVQALSSCLGEDWLQQILLKEPRSKKHPLFWILLSPKECLRLGNNLKILNENCPKFGKIVQRIKADKDEHNFCSLLSEIEVLSHYYQALGANNVEYEPAVPERNKKADAKLQISDREYYLEIFTVFEDETGKKIEELQQKVRDRLDELEQPYVILFSTEVNFEHSDIEGFVNFVKNLVTTNKDSVKDKSQHNYLREDSKIAEVIFLEHEHMKGCVGGMFGPVRAINPPGRIKQKMLSKIEQLPEAAPNIVIVNLSYITSDFIELEEAFLGQSCVNINVFNKTGTWMRDVNGVVHHSKGTNISLAIAYTQNDFAHRRFILNKNAKNKINEAEIEIIMR